MEHLSDYIQKEIDVKKLFYDSVLKEYFRIESNVKWKRSHSYEEFDLVLMKNDLLYAIVEIKFSLSPKNLQVAKSRIQSSLSFANCRFGIVTDGVSFYLFDTSTKDGNYKKLEFEPLVQCLLDPVGIPDTFSGDNNNNKEKIIQSFKKYFADTVDTTISDDICYDKNQGFYTFVNAEKEKKFFQLLLNVSKVKGAVYRYTSIDTLFAMLNKGTYRMSGIVGMNDKSEIDYFDKMCPIDITGSSVRELNETFLTSCSFLKDDLTMWRLYGDDAKGVCLEFELTPIDKRYGGFVLAPVSYAENRDSHKALELLKELSDLNVRFAEINKWKHFFKPYDYNVEQEVRLMFFDNGRYDNGVICRDWVRTWTHSIINPFVDFKMNASKFPLQLKQILLGPKMQERKINKIQLEDLLSTKGLNIDVDESKIENYR